MNADPCRISAESVQHPCSDIGMDGEQPLAGANTGNACAYHELKIPLEGAALAQVHYYYRRSHLCVQKDCGKSIS